MSILIVLLSKEDKHRIKFIEFLIAKVLSQFFLFVSTLFDHPFLLCSSLSFFLLIKGRLRFELKVAIEDLVIQVIDLLDLVKILIIGNVKFLKVILYLNPFLFWQIVQIVRTTCINWPIVLLIHLIIHDLVTLWTLWHCLCTLYTHLNVTQSK